MEIRQLRYFVAIAEVGSFGGAAGRCNVAQPSLSQQIGKLERELGYRLFDRLGRRIALTEAGKALLPRARRILAEVRDAGERLAGDLSSGRGPLTVGAIPTMAPYLLPATVGHFTRHWPEARLTIREDFTPRLIDALVAAEIDLALMSTPVELKAVEQELLFEERLLVAVSARGPFASRRRFRRKDLDSQPVLLLDEIHCLGRQVQDFCRAMRLQQPVVCRAVQLATVQRLVEQELGVALVPEMAAREDRAGRLVYLEVEGESPRRPVFLARRSERSRPFLDARFAECLRETYGAGALAT